MSRSGVGDDELPVSKDAQRQRAKSFFSVRKLPEAHVLDEQLSRDDPLDTESHYMLGLMYGLFGEFELVGEYLRRPVAIDAFHKTGRLVVTPSDGWVCNPMLHFLGGAVEALRVGHRARLTRTSGMDASRRHRGFGESRRLWQARGGCRPVALEK